MSPKCKARDLNWNYFSAYHKDHPMIRKKQGGSVRYILAQCSDLAHPQFQRNCLTNEE